MIVGMDFGTTNSGMAVYDGQSINVLPLDPANRNPRVLRTALYVTNEQSVQVGRRALDHYFEQNIGRPVKMRKVWIGELDVYGADMYYVTDAYATVDVLSPGRLFLSIKSSLRDPDYPGTVVGQFYFPLEDLIALYLTVAKVRAEQLLGRDLRRVVLGRPVRFSDDPEKDRLAQGRLLQAAFRAGYEQVYLQYEPVAAAFSYETTLDREQNVLVFDFGGGTLDITIMRLGERKRRQVLATGGIPVAGDVFDQKLVRNKLARHFGEGSLYGPRHKARQTPRWIFDVFSDWQTILELQTAENKRILEEIAQSARRRFRIEQLIALVSGNYGLMMFDTVEQAKRRLSEKRGADIRLQGEGFDVREFVTRTEFESIIRAEIVRIEQHVQETIETSGLRPEQIDAVIRTGGSAQIPAFYEMLCGLFGTDKVHSIDTFSSVTAGLGVIGHGIAAGEIDLPVYTPGDVKAPADETPTRPNVSPIQLDLLQRRIGMEERGEALAAQALVLVWLDGMGEQITAVSLIPDRLQDDTDIPLAELNATCPIRQMLAAQLDERLLLITSKYRFLLLTPRQLLEQQAIDVRVDDLYQLEEYESLAVVCSWDRALQQDKLVLVTSTGLARPYPLDVLRANVEAPVPLRFERPLAGDPIAALAGTDGEQLILVTAKSRAVRYPVAKLSITGTQAINCGRNDRVVAAMLANAHDDLLLVTNDGYGRILRPDWIEIPTKTNSKGKVQVARRSGVAGLTSGQRPWLVTGQRLAAVAPPQLPAEDSTKTYPLLQLAADEAVDAVLHLNKSYFSENNNE